MALGYLDDSKLYAIASAIRSKTSKSAAMTVDEMPTEIESITTGAQVEPLSVTANGTYTAQSGYAYSPVTVSVSGGASNIVIGTFTSKNQYSSTNTIDIPYTGVGYPIAFMLFVSDGLKNTTTGHTAWSNLVRRYAVGMYAMVKDQTNVTPTFDGSDAGSTGIVYMRYKNSTSDASTIGTLNVTNNMCSTTDPTVTSASCIKFVGDFKTLKYLTVGNSGTKYGLAPNMGYTYVVVYSS